MSYFYSREDNGQIVEVDFETAMSQQAGFITLPDGVAARRVHFEEHQQPSGERKKLQSEIISDTLGVTDVKLDEYRQNAEQYGYRVEWTQDPHEPTYYQARFPSWKERDRYMRFRGLCDKNSRNGGGAALSADCLERAKQRLLEQSQ